MRALLLGAVLLLIACAPAHADDYQTCNKADNFEQRSQACTNIVAAPAETAEHRATAYVHLCKVWADRNDLPRAALACENANMLYTLAENFNNLGSAEFDTGHYAEALADFETALLLDPELSEAKDNLAVALVKLKPPHSVADATPKK